MTTRSIPVARHRHLHVSTRVVRPLWAAVALVFTVSACSSTDAPAGPTGGVAAAEPRWAAGRNPESRAADPELRSLWDDPVFQRQFVAFYGVNSEVEPRVTPEDVKILEKIRPLMADDLPQAELVLQGLMKPGSSALFDYTLGRIQFQQGKFADALRNYVVAVEKFPSFRRAWRDLGLVYARDGRNDEAINAFTRLITLGGADGYSYGLLGYAYAAKQDYQAAEVAYRNALLLQPDNTEWRFQLARCALKEEKFEDAATLLGVLIERSPDKADFWLLQARAYLGMKQPLKAAENLEAMSLVGGASVDSLHTLGDIYVNENLLDLAAVAYQRAVDADPKQPLVRPLRAADGMAARGALPQAKLLTAHIHEAWDKTMDDADRRKLLKIEARIAVGSGSGGPETAAVLEEVLKLDPLDGEALMLLGQHYAKQAQPDKAMFYYERAEGLEAFEVNARLRHAQVLVSLTRYADALPLLRRAQELKPREETARYLEQVERVAKARR